MGRVLQPFEYYEPLTVTEALSLMSSASTKVLAGGCDLVPSMRCGIVRPTRVVSLRKVRGLDVLKLDPRGGFHAGALVKIHQCATHAREGDGLAALWDAVELVQPHIRNMGTLIGNVCSAVPFLDIPVALVALQAEIRITNGNSQRALLVEDFYTAAGTTALKAGELVLSIALPPPAQNASSAHFRINKGRRREADLPKVNASCYVALDAPTKTIVEAVIAVGCCSFRPLRMREAEAVLKGAPAERTSYARAAAAAAKCIAPLTNAPWVEETRQEFVHALVFDALEKAAHRASSKTNTSRSAA